MQPANEATSQLNRHMRPYLPLTTYYLLLSLLIFLAPTNLFWKILPNYGYVGGLQIDYLIPKLYISDLVGLAIVGLWILETVVSGTRRSACWPKWWVGSKNSKSFKEQYLQPTTHYLLLGVCYLLLFSRQFFTPLPISAVWFFLVTTVHIATFCVVLKWTQSIGLQKMKNLFFLSITLTVIFQSSVGLFQFIYQRPVFGFLFFGEPQLKNSVGMIKADLSSFDQFFHTELGLRILPYGTTAHSNVLGGFLALSLLSILFIQLNRIPDKEEHSLLVQSIKTPLFIVSFSMGMFTLLLSLSISAWATFLLGLFVLFFQKFAGKKSLKIFLLCCVISIATPILVHRYALHTETDNSSITRRDRLNITAVNLIKKNLFIGVGANQFTAIYEDLPNQKEIARFAQPTHNVFLLFLAENGLLGVFILTIFLLIRTRHLQKDSAYLQFFLLALPILGLDHYFYTLVPGQYVFLISGCYAVFLLQCNSENIHFGKQAQD